MRGFSAILYKEFIIVLRDRTTLFFMFFPALLQIIAYGYALEMDVRNIHMAVLNEDRTPQSFWLVDKFVNTQAFRVVEEVHSVDDLSAAIRSGHASIGLQIPPGYSRDILAGRTAHVQALIDGSNSTVALKALNTAMGVTFLSSITNLLRTSGREMPVELRPQVLYNPSMLSPNFYIPGIIGIALQIATLFATTLSIVRERESGTIENLIVSPMSRWALMFGKLVPYLVISMIMATVLFIIMRWLFLIPINGSLSALYVSTLLYVFSMLSLGLLLSTWAQNHMQAMELTLAFILPSIFFSGYIFPRETMPWIFYAVGAVLPTTYFIALMRAIVLRGADFVDFWNQILILAGMGAFLFAMCILRFRQRIA